MIHWVWALAAFIVGWAAGAICVWIIIGGADDDSGGGFDR